MPGRRRSKRSQPIDYSHPVVRAAQPRNQVILALYQVVVRVGWIFKTESVIMPAFLDLIGGPGWVRGCLPALNRFGQSVPPVLYARRLSAMPLKRASLWGTTLVMAAVFLALAGLWSVYERTWWMPAAVLILYGVFFSSTGLNQMALSTLQGKLLQPTVRGRNLLWSSTVGALLAVLLAWWLLRDWLEPPQGRFDYIFGFTGLCFILSALLIPFIVEPPDQYDVPKMRWADHFSAAGRILHKDANFRRLAVVAMLFSTVLNLFPHYQRFAFDRFDSSLDDMVPWVIAQNIGVGLYSLVAGPLADLRGNRIVLKLLVVCAAAAPLLAVGFTYAPHAARDWYWTVFLLLGLTPITIRTLYNYTLEICPVADHPRYLSTLSLCMAVPLLFSPLTGEMGDSAGFERVFIGGAVLILIGGLLTFTLVEPRHRKIETVEPTAVVPDDSTFPGGTV